MQTGIVNKYIGLIEKGVTINFGIVRNTANGVYFEQESPDNLSSESD